MPKRKTEDAVHVAMTDHKIQRRPRAEPVNRAPGEPVPYFPASARDRDIYQGAALIVGGWDRKKGIEMLERQSDLPAKAKSVLGEGYFAEGQYAKASKTLTNPYNLALSLQREGRADEARKLLEGINTPEAANAMGDYRRSIQLRALNPEAYRGLTLALFAQKRIPKALEAARKAVALDPSEPRTRYNLGQLLQETGAMEAALKEYREAIRLQPSFIEAHLAFGQALGDAGKIPAALAEFREVLKLDPNHAEAKRMMALAESVR
jgi:tetratricopeptide (TPR) repeat protein